MSFDILFLGTGAADRMHLEQEKDFADKDKRRCAAALLNGHVLLDCGPHILNALTAAQISLENITDILVTHLHPDHFCASCVEEIAKANPKVKIWVRNDAEVNLSFECCVEKMVCFNEYTVGELKVASAPANHAAFPQHFSIECDSKKIFYGLDGAWFLGDTVRFMKNQKYNMFIFDATVGDYVGDYRMGEHNSIPMIRLLLPSMKTLNIIDDNTQIVLSHLAVCLHKSHDETCEITQKDNFIISYDGLKLDI